MTKQASELRYAVRPVVIFKYFGQLCLVLAALTLLPFVISLMFGEMDIGARYITVIVGLVLLGGALARLPAPSNVQANEGMVLVASIFFFAPLVMSYTMMGSGLSFSDALFETISAITTTGLSTNATLAGAPDTFLFTRAWMQWYGGLGIVVLSLALVIRPGLVAKGLAVTEPPAEDLVGGTRVHARRALMTYMALSVIGIVGSLLVGVGPFDSVLYTFSAVSTGGFAPHDGSLAALGGPARTWITLLCLAGAIPLTLYYRAWRKEQRAAVDYLQLQTVLLAAVSASIALGASMRFIDGMAWDQIFRHAPLMALSAQTTAGFSSMQPSLLDPNSKVILIFSMLVGGGVGSTAGGFKLLRLLIVVSVLRLIVLRTCLPRHAVLEPRLAGRRLQGEEIQEALLLILLFIAVVAVSWFLFVMMGYAPLDSLFEVVSATGTVGLSVGLTTTNLPLFLKAVLCADMLLGRLEIIAWLVMLFPGTWFGRRLEAT